MNIIAVVNKLANLKYLNGLRVFQYKRRVYVPILYKLYLYLCHNSHIS